MLPENTPRQIKRLAEFMKLHLDNPDGRNTVTAYGPGYIAINQQRHEASLILLPDRVIEGWGAQGFDALNEADFETLRDLHAEIVVLGTGQRQRFPSPSLLRPLIDAHVGFEIMDVQAACRTYNILMAEGRKVVAALLID